MWERGEERKTRGLRGGGGGVGGTDGVLMTYLCRYRITSMHLIGWQNTWEQAPGVRHPFPALMAGDALAVYLCTRP